MPKPAHVPFPAIACSCDSRLSRLPMFPIANAVTVRLSLWGIEMRVWIPANAVAAVHVPARDAAAVPEGEGGSPPA